MAGTTKVPLGGNPRPNVRPKRPSRQSSRAPSVAPATNRARSRLGAASPAESLVTAPNGRLRSPTSAGTKRKERDYEAELMEETNIHVVVRCRGRNDREVRENSGVVVSTEGAEGSTVELSMGPNSVSNKTYHFDRVFSPAADQGMVYDGVVSPILDEMLHGFNCTIFAYGQTGTGKTYTMSGDMTETLGLLSDEAGIIPRVLTSLFRKMNEDGADYSVKCSFIELYNEELKDLLSAEENAKLKLYEDNQKKGHTATIISGMEESHIKSASDGIRLLQAGSHKRQVAATKCNDLSSRSHTVFTVTCYIKRTSDAGEDYVVAGKLNLVDLAGSENIQRSGAENKRAAEAGLINKSLLTLGRVINALVDRSSHIPYRESKLTRLLQDSLGGRTKTCIIATISPAKSNVEETISTLDYAFRAKNIRNKPQVNPNISKKTLLREFTAEIEKLKSELIATRHRNGVYLSNEAYEDMIVESESRRILSEEQRARIETMEANLRNKVQELFGLTSNFAILKKDSEGVKSTLEDTAAVLKRTELALSDTTYDLAEETRLRQAHQATEEQLSTMGNALISTLNRTVQDVDGLRAKLKRKSDVQSLNRTTWHTSQTKVQEVTELAEDRLVQFQEAQGNLLNSLSERLALFIQNETAQITEQRDLLTGSTKDFEDMQTKASEASSNGKVEMDCVLEEIKTLREQVKSNVGTGLQGLSAAAGRISNGIVDELEQFHTQLYNSYSSLGRDFKNIFDDLNKHIESQRAEAEELRDQLVAATEAALSSEERNAQELQDNMQQERERAAADRQALMDQIASLVHANGKVQEDRIQERVQAACRTMAFERNKLSTAKQEFTEAMDAWSSKETQLADQVREQRDLIKAKLQKDWATADEHNATIQNTTKSVHEETVLLVDVQLRDMPVQMQALDDFVGKARACNETYHGSQMNKLEVLAAETRTNHDRIQGRMDESVKRMHAAQKEIDESCVAVRRALPALDELVAAPLSALRQELLARPLQEYQATGETPQKMIYEYAKTLPRTTAQRQEKPSEACESREAELDLAAEIPDLLEGTVSPSKGTVFTDSPPLVMEALVEKQRPATAEGGLREITGNINNSVVRGVGEAKLETEQLSRSLMGPPPLKRHATDTNNVTASKLARPTARGRVHEGRENLPLSASLGNGRRLRSSPGSA